MIHMLDSGYWLNLSVCRWSADEEFKTLELVLHWRTLSHTPSHLRAQDFTSSSRCSLPQGSPTQKPAPLNTHTHQKKKKGSFLSQHCINKGGVRAISLIVAKDSQVRYVPIMLPSAAFSSCHHIRTNPSKWLSSRATMEWSPKTCGCGIRVCMCVWGRVWSTIPAQWMN